MVLVEGCRGKGRRCCFGVISTGDATLTTGEAGSSGAYRSSIAPSSWASSSVTSGLRSSYPDSSWYRPAGPSPGFDRRRMISALLVVRVDLSVAMELEDDATESRRVGPCGV